MKPILRLCFLAGFLACAGTVLATDPKPAPARPNIIFILVDDIRWDAFGCMGHPFVKTPNIDRLAREGMLFRNYFVTLPLCSPSRASILTGQYAHAHGVVDNTDHSALSHQLVTFPRLLHDAGYETAFVGKWHMGNDDTPRPGFDHWLSFKGQGVYLNPNLNIDGKPTHVDGYITDILNTSALEFIQQEHTKPFLLYIGHKAVHGPFTPATRHETLYTSNSLPHPPSIDDNLEGKPVLTRKVEDVAPKKANPKKQKAAFDDEAEVPLGRVPERTVRQQLRALMAIEEGVGQLLAALEKSGQLDRTMIIFTSDNGYFWGEHHLGDKRWAYEESIRDPLFIRYPRLIKAGSIRDQMVLNIDIAPTLLELAGAPPLKSAQGRSLLPLFAEEQPAWRSSAFFEYYQEKAYPRTPTWQAVRTDHWKLIRYTDLPGMDELYDLKADPYEMKNLIDAESAKSSLQEMEKELGKQRKQTAKQE